MIGNILLTLGLAASLFSIIMYYFSFKGYTNTTFYARIGYHLMSLSIIGASAFLLYAILGHHYEYKYVFNYSNGDLSTGLLMSTFWAGQEGSFMIWLFFSVIVGLILLEYTSKRGDLEPRVMLVYTLSNAFLLLLVSPMLKNPFTFIWSDINYVELKHLNNSILSMPFIQQFMVEDQSTGQAFVRVGRDLYAQLAAKGIAFNQFIVDGKGLNPLLQNFWMQIHPPILFVGFAMSAVPFSFAFAALLKNEYNAWIKQSLPWIIASMLVLGLAIMLGGYWAYGVLGWGGWWGWDPVENSSLVPWIVGMALIHTMLVQKKTQKKDGVGRFGKTNLILAIMTFLLVLYSTFLTRSGILGDASVHSFAEPENLVYWLLIAFVGVFTLLGIGAIIVRWKYLEKHFNFEDNLLSKELALFTGSVALIASSIIILVGTSAPIFGNAVEISFYNELNLPIAIIIGLLNGFSLLLKWKQTKGKSLLQQSKISLALTVLFSIIIIWAGGISDFMLILFTFSTLFALSVNLEVIFKIIKGRKLFLGAYITHTGLAIFFLGIIASGGFTKETQVRLFKNEPQQVLGYDLTFQGYSPFEGNKYAFNVEIAKDNETSVIAPVMYISSFNNQLMREPDILTWFTKDFYISPLSYDEGEAEHNHSGEILAMNKGETKSYNDYQISFTKFNVANMTSMGSEQSPGSITVGAEISVSDGEQTFEVEPKVISSGTNRSFTPVEIPEFNMILTMTELNAAGSIKLNITEMNPHQGEENIETPRESLTIEASVKPFISLVWIGVLIIIGGMFIATIRRLRESLS